VLWASFVEQGLNSRQQTTKDKAQSTKYKIREAQSPKNKHVFPGVIMDMRLVRLAKTADAEVIASVMYEAFSQYRSLYTAEGFAATAITSEEVVSRMSQGPMFVTLVDDAIVGTVSVVKKNDSLYIRGMAVLPASRGNRIGAIMLNRIEEYAANEGCERLFLSTTPFLERAIMLYEKFGFTRTNEGPHDLFGTPLFTMEKRL
jgi:ribosomal protein S18 acetylase RimI-like enzyme